MSMTVVVTRNVEGRYRGFLASVMLEVAPGYTSPPILQGCSHKNLVSSCAMAQLSRQRESRDNLPGSNHLGKSPVASSRRSAQAGVGR